MADWWVNHKQTGKQEVAGDFLWSPKRNKGNRRSESYENMKNLRVGDRVFSYAHQRVGAVGIVVREAQTASKPTSFGTTGGWSPEGWLVGVRFKTLEKPLSPKEHLAVIAPLLPSKYSPIRRDGNGNQVTYLAAISETLGNAIAELIDLGATASAGSVDAELLRDLRQILGNDSIPETQREQLVQARVGQGLFRAEVFRLEPKCRLTQTTDPRFLRASHIKPWCESTNAERLDGSNGLMLAPHIDLLFDRGFISFAANGKLMISSELPSEILAAWAIRPRKAARPFSAAQARYLQHHQEKIFRKG